jgi:UDP-glucose:(heptosyl)LPS alpha-1,3-glucosyltransferase
MKLALVRARYDPFGGAERFVQNAVESLADTGVSLTILTRKWPEQANTAIAHHVLNPRYFTSTGRDKTFAEAVQQHIAASHYDLVQSHERIPGCDIYRAGDGVHAEWLTQRARVQGGFARFTTHLNPHHRYVLDAERAMFTSPKLRAVICISEMVKRDIQRHFSIDEKKLHVIHNGVDTTKFSPQHRDEHRLKVRASIGVSANVPVALFVGSGFERKGLAVFLRALATQKDELHAIVVGKDKHIKRYQTLADQLGIASRVHFTGGVNDTRPWYAAADVFCLPTLYEPFGNVIAEALASGLPVVTSTTCGGSEWITDGRNGFVCDALDVAAISGRLRDCANNPQMGVAAREAVAAITPSAMAAQYVALYQRLLGGDSSV